MNIKIKFVCCILTVVIGFICGVRRAECIGQTGHMVVTEMATDAIDETEYVDLVSMLETFQSERSCGSVFPDWAWISSHQEYSKVAHTVAFQQVWADYATTNFQSPYTTSKKREISFLMGITTHTYGDPPWHTFFLSEASAHDNVDEWLVEPGTDIFANWELSKRSEVTYGYLPATTAAHIYALLGYPEVTESMLVKGMRELRAAYWVEKLVGYQGYLNLIQRMPWTNGNYVTYSPGGYEYDGDISSEEMVNTWNYIQGNLTQLQRGDELAFTESNTLGEIGQSLIESGAIEIPMGRSQGGEYFFGEPRIINADSFQKIMRGFFLSEKNETHFLFPAFIP